MDSTFSDALKYTIFFYQPSEMDRLLTCDSSEVTKIPQIRAVTHSMDSCNTFRPFPVPLPRLGVMDAGLTV